jgi:hypothetical protein
MIIEMSTVVKTLTKSESRLLAGGEEPRRSFSCEHAASAHIGNQACRNEKITYRQS